MSVQIKHKPLRHGIYNVYVYNSETNDLVDYVTNVQGANLRNTIEKMAESYDDVQIQPIPQDTRTWS